jgi:GNAT superfamily N-acetyltransferase
MAPTDLAALTFRPAGASDEDQLLAFIQALYDHERIPYERATARAALSPLLTGTAPGAVWLIEAEGAPLGYMVLIFSYYLEFGPTAIVDEIYVDPAWRGRGVGAHALTFAEAESRRRGMVRMRLEVERQNPAQALYERTGFVAHDRDLMTKDL